MNRKQVAILQRFLEKDNWHISRLSADFDISPRMVRHELNDINYYLKRMELPEIIANRREGFAWPADANQKHTLSVLLSSLDSYDYSLSSEERQTVMALFMLASDRYMTSTSFATLLGVSKSCIDKDLGVLRESLAKIEISLESRSGKGSRICGDELALRNYCYKEMAGYVDLYGFIQNTNAMDSYVGRCARELYCDEYLFALFEIIRALETDKIGKQFSEKSLSYVLYYLAIMLVRVRNGKTIEMQGRVFSGSKDSDEYGYAKSITKSIEEKIGISLPEGELNYVAFLLRGVQYVEPEPYDKDDWAEIQLLSGRLIQNMKLRTHVDFACDEELNRALQTHLGRTVFNLRHGITTINPTLSDVRAKYPDYLAMMRDSIQQLNTGLLKKITDDDLAYLTVHFCASAERRRRSSHSARIAIVCTNGAGTASLLKELICSRFPTLKAVAITTSSDIGRIKSQVIDFAVSSVALVNCPFPFIKVNPIPTPADYEAIERMLSECGDSRSTGNEVTKLFGDIMEMMEGYVSEPDGETLVEKLRECFENNGFQAGKSKLLPTLLESLPQEHILCGCKAENWEQAVRIACGPLLASSAVTEEYINSAIGSVKSSGPYIVISNGIALVHSQIGRGVNRLSVGFSTFTEGVCFYHPEFDPVKVIMCLAPTDGFSHTGILRDIIRLFEQTDAKTLTAIEDAAALRKCLADLLGQDAR